jgi:tripartite-type tricarboxylate transporter receptor subunit TctC
MCERTPCASIKSRALAQASMRLCVGADKNSFSIGRLIRAGTVALCLMTGLLELRSAHAEASYPSQTIKFIVPYSAGGLPDTVARVIGRRLQERVGQAVVVENRPGANGNVAAASLASSQADGYTLMVSDGSILTINPRIYSKLAYDPERDFAPVALLARAPLLLAVHRKVPVATLQEFIDYTKSHPGQLVYGSSGVGSTHHLSMEAIKAALKLDINHVPFKGTGQSVPALLGGHVDALFSAYPSLSGALGGNGVKLLASNGPDRLAELPEVPTVAELIPGCDFAPIVGILAPSATPRPIIQKVAAEAIEAVHDPDTARRLLAAGIQAVSAGPDEYARMIKNEAERVAKVVQLAGIKFD